MAGYALYSKVPSTGTPKLTSKWLLLGLSLAVGVPTLCLNTPLNETGEPTQLTGAWAALWALEGMDLSTPPGRTVLALLWLGFFLIALLTSLAVCHVRTYVHMYIHTYVCMYVCMHVCMYACMYVCMYVCVYVCMYVCMCVCVCMYVCMYACMYVCCTPVAVLLSCRCVTA